MPIEVYTPYSLGESLLLFLGIPLLFIVVVALLVYAPGWTRSGRHRPGQGWDADPLWIAPGGADTGPPELPATPDSPSETGGSSGRW